MRSFWTLLYWIGFTPWSSRTEHDQLDELLDRLPPGDALDLGCGTGADAVHLARRGWQVVGIDGVSKALRTARSRAAAAGVSVDFVSGDVARLEELVRGRRFELVQDVGCFHVLSEADRARCASGVNAVTEPGAYLLMLAAEPRTGRVGPRGVDVADLRRHFGPQWTLEHTQDYGAPASRGPMKDLHFHWYRWRREG